MLDTRGQALIKIFLFHGLAITIAHRIAAPHVFHALDATTTRSNVSSAPDRHIQSMVPLT